MLVVQLEPGDELTPALIEELQTRNLRLADFKRVSGYLLYDEDFPRTASLKIKRRILAERIATKLNRTDVRTL